MVGGTAIQIERSATFSECRTWRYTLDRHWEGYEDPRTVLFCLLNPSIADALRDDPTNRRGIGFGKSWGFNRCVFVNEFGFRSPDPKVMKQAPDPVGPDNDKWIVQRAEEADLIVCAWGAHGPFRGRDVEVKRLLGDFDLHHLGLTKAGHPKHILYLPGDLEPTRWKTRCC